MGILIYMLVAFGLALYLIIKRKQYVIGIFAIVAIGIVCFISFAAPTIAYNKSLKLIAEGNYERAADVLDAVSSDDHDSIWLLSYANTRAKYGENPTGKEAVYAYDKLEKVVEYGDYLPCYDEICRYAKQVKAAADEEIRRQRAEIKAGLPYVGMDPEYIHDTKLGKGKLSFSTDDLDVYTWDAADGCMIFWLEVYKGKVVETDKRNDIHWSGDNWKNLNHKNFSAPSYSYNSDPYDAEAYSSADDFYYDYYNDFFDYEEAEDYWYEHN